MIKLSWRLITALVVLLIALIVCSAYIYDRVESSHSIIPKSLKNSLNFLVIYPQQSSVYKINKSSFKYDASLKLLTYLVIDTGDNANLTFSEQSTPIEFVEIPQTYTAFLNGHNEYASYDSALGTFYLTTPESSTGNQVAIMNESGTLLFISTSKNLQDIQWQKLFNSLLLLH